MARPGKQGIDYFPLDVHIDDKLRFIKAKFGWEGYGIIIGLFQHIYSQGYWCPWSGDDDFLYAEENRIERTLLIKIVEEALRRDLFSQKLYKTYQILTSCGIQKRYAEIIKRRKNVDIKSEYVLIGRTLCKYDVNIMCASCKHDDCKSTQRKGNGKEMERKGEETEIVPPSTPLNPILKKAVDDMREALAMSDHEIQSVYTICSNPERLKEAVQCAIELDAWKRKQNTAIDNPVEYIRKCYEVRKISAETRHKYGKNHVSATVADQSPDKWDRVFKNAKEEGMI